MNINETIARIEAGGFDQDFQMLYGETTASKKRYVEACNEFRETFGDRENIRLFSAPGRTEIGGNHTDHQHGRVLAGSVNLDVIAVVSQNDEGMIRLKSAGYDLDTVDTGILTPQDEETSHSPALIRGVCAAFHHNGHKIGGFDAYTTSNVLKGSGLSSSAAFEVLVANILNGLYNDGVVEPIELAKYAQFAEREFFGKPCGLLDQMASSMGGFTYADFNDPANPYVEKLNFDIKAHEYTLCVVDTGGNHSDLTQDYADITLECRAISEELGVSFLRDADQILFWQKIAELKKTCGDRAVLRALHFFREDQRAFDQFAALQDDRFEDFLKLVKESAESSYDYLQNMYSPANPREQGLSLGVALTRDFLKGEGACRVHGGGFAGTIQCYVPEERFPYYKQYIESFFGSGSCVELSIRPVGGYELV